jgi:hypothetical protein
VLVIDGNMKNRRDVCAATEAGFTEYEGLPGMIKTGCQLSPCFQSKYCYAHAPRVSRKVTEANAQQESTEDDIVGVITAKKELRGRILYQVNACVCSIMSALGMNLFCYCSGCLAWA